MFVVVSSLKVLPGMHVHDSLPLKLLAKCQAAHRDRKEEGPSITGISVHHNMTDEQTDRPEERPWRRAKRQKNPQNLSSASLPCWSCCPMRMLTPDTSEAGSH